MALPLNIPVRVAVDEGLPVSRPPAFSGVDTEPATQRMLGSPRVSWGPGVGVEVGGRASALLVAPRPAKPRDKEARLEPAMGPRLFGDVPDVLSGGGSAGSSDPWTLLLLFTNGLPCDSGKLPTSVRSSKMSQNRPAKWHLRSNWVRIIKCTEQTRLTTSHRPTMPPCTYVHPPSL